MPLVKAFDKTRNVDSFEGEDKGKNKGA